MKKAIQVGCVITKESVDKYNEFEQTDFSKLKTKFQLIPVTITTDKKAILEDWKNILVGLFETTSNSGRSKVFVAEKGIGKTTLMRLFVEGVGICCIYYLSYIYKLFSFTEWKSLRYSIYYT